MPRFSRVMAASVLCAFVVSCPGARAEDENFNPTVQREDAHNEQPSDNAALPKVKIDLQNGPLEDRVERILAEMTLDEKIGQLCQISSWGDTVNEDVADDIRAGRIGSLFYTGSASQTREAQRLAIEESRLGLPLLSPRDVIHGFRTVFPIPLGQAASWNPDLVHQAARVSAIEARAQGVNWTFAPMLDITRDARWGRIAESLGEDPLIASRLARALVTGFQWSETGGVAACGKHFVAYGLSEGGRDYNRAQVAVSDLHNVFLAPFRAAVDAGAGTIMTSFSSINGVPGTGHRELIRDVLKRDWGFDGLVVSDWGSVIEMIEHGYAKDKGEAAHLALRAGVDMEMATDCFQASIKGLLETDRIDIATIDDAVRRTLRIKLRYALPQQEQEAPADSAPTEESLALARELSVQSMVLLKNEGSTLPLKAKELRRIAVVGPLADAARDQLGCWMLDGRPEEAITPTAALREALGDAVEVRFAAGLTKSVDETQEGFEEAVEAVTGADVAVVCVGEEWWLSGEARCRVELDLPGAQKELVETLSKTGTPLVMVVMAGRPLTIQEEAECAAAVIYAWHPGTMGGAALADILLGAASPSGRLPVTFPKHVGQAPIYYNHTNTGRPPLQGTEALIGSGRQDFPEDQKYRSHYLDVDPFPLYPFGFGLSYTRFEYSDLQLSTPTISPGQTLGVRVTLTNVGDTAGEEVAQLYVRDVIGSLVRPVRELKDFRRVRLDPGESEILEFALHTDQLAYYDNERQLLLEPGAFLVGVGGDSTAPLDDGFELTPAMIASDQADNKQATARYTSTEK